MSETRISYASLFSLPNLLTLVNLLSGCVAIVFIFNFQMEWVPYCTLICLIADFLDGFTARLIKSSSGLGKQLDSLADVVSFGVVPGAIFFQLLVQKFESSSGASPTLLFLYSSPAFLLPLFSALRLAKFNVDTRQSQEFLGLPTPAMTVFVVGILLLVLKNPFGLTEIVFQQTVIYPCILALCVLMVVDIPMFSLKSFQWKGNEVVFLFIFLCLILLATLKFAAVSLIIVLYILTSIALKIFKQ